MLKSRGGYRGTGEVGPKYQTIFESLKADILSGRLKPGQKMPSEATLVDRTGASRITVGRAVQELKQVGLVERVAGSGTYVRARGKRDPGPYSFGLLIPDLGDTETFERICQGIAGAPQAAEHALLWGHSVAGKHKTDQPWLLCQQFVARKVAGVFFAPLEGGRDAEKMNAKILTALWQAEIVVVLVDRRFSKAVGRNRPDFVGMNHRQAGYTAAEHLIQHGCKRIGFVGYGGGESTTAERKTGYADALAAHGLRPAGEGALQVSEGREQAISWTGKGRPPAVDGFVCGSDRVAGQLMHVLSARNMRVPEDVRIVGIDDVSYAALLRVPLTTVRQPVREIGEAAIRTMLERIENPEVPPREILLDGELVVRRSCGAE